MRLAVVVALVLGIGCKGPCEKLCSNMATYAQECGFAVADSEIDACEADLAGVTAAEKDVCRDFGGPDVLRTEWTCDDLESYWSGGGEE